MRRLSIFICLITLFLNSVYAQSGEFKWGDQLDKKKIPDIIFLKKDSQTNNSFWFSFKDTKCLLIAYDSNNVKLYSKPLLFPKEIREKINSNTYIKVLSLKDEFYLFLQCSSTKHSLNSNYIFKVSYDGTLSQNFGTLAGNSSKNSYRSLCFLSTTLDSSKIVVSLIGFPNKSTKYKSSFYLFNRDLTLMSSKEYESHENYKFILQDNCLVTDGLFNVYFLDMNIDKTNSRRNNDQIILVRLNIETGIINEFPLNELSDKKIQDIGITINRNGVVLVCGFFKKANNKNLSEIFNGAFFGKVKSNLVEFNFLDIANDEVLNRQSPDMLLKLVRYIPKEDGGIILLSEQLLIDHNNKRCGNILIMNLNNEGKVIYSQTAFKNQVMLLQMGYAGYHSFYPIYRENDKKLIIIYNDNPKNLVHTKEHNPNQTFAKQSIPVLIELDSSGKQTKKSILLEPRTPSVILCPIFSDKVNEYELFVFGKEKKMFRLGSLKLFRSTQRETHLNSIVWNPSNVKERYLGIGIKRIGFSFGNVHAYSGIRVNVFDKEVKKFNGLNLVLVKSHIKKNNGISVGFLVNRDERLNGISFGSFADIGIKRNGVSISPFLAVHKSINGLLIGGFGAVADTLNGVELSLISGGNHINGLALGIMGLTGWGNINGVGLSTIQMTKNIKGFCASLFFILSFPDNSHIKGVAISSSFIYANVVHGVTISGFNISDEHKGVSIGIVNRTKKLNGIQLGLVNYAGNNPRGLKYLPFVNIHIKKRKH